MKVKVHMLAFEEEYKVREVTMPDECIAVDREFLDLVFYYGQNDFAIGPEKNTTCSVSVGDVIELGSFRLFLVAAAGFRPMTEVEFLAYMALERRERQLLTFN